MGGIADLDHFTISLINDKPDDPTTLDLESFNTLMNTIIMDTNEGYEARTFAEIQNNYGSAEHRGLRLMHGERDPFSAMNTAVDNHFIRNDWLTPATSLDVQQAFPRYGHQGRQMSPDTVHSSSSGMLSSASSHSAPPMESCPSYYPFSGLEHADLPSYWANEAHMTPQSLGGGDSVAPQQLQHRPEVEFAQSCEQLEGQAQEQALLYQFRSNCAIASPEEGQMPSINGFENLNEVTADEDADGETVDDSEAFSEQECNASDTEYRPTGAHNSGHGRRVSQAARSTPKFSARKPARGSKASKVVKKQAKSSGHLSNKSRDLKSSAALKAEAGTEPGNEVSADKPFPCLFTRYGCNAGFPNKNEWKRHAETKHMEFGYWRCIKCPDESNGRYNFCRKDLFKQHLVRLHGLPKKDNHFNGTNRDTNAGAKVKIESSTTPRNNRDSSPVTLDNFDAFEQKCYIEERPRPATLSCVICQATFSGKTGWMDGIEHIGKHFETCKKNGERAPAVETWSMDRSLENWLVSHGVLRRDGARRSLVENGRRKKVSVSN